MDTVVIKIIDSTFKVTNIGLFSPELKFFTEQDIPQEMRHHPHKFYRKYTQNASADDKSEGIYKPCLTLYRYLTEGKVEYHLHIQFSAPKLLYSQNVRELREGDLDDVIKALQHKLQTMGIETSEDTLRISEVTKVHFGKNIEIIPPSTVSEIIDELKKIDLGERMDINQRDYRNGGESLHIYNGSRNYIFYDKVKDLGKTRVRSADKDKTILEKKLGEELKDAKKQILRFEIRFTNVSLVKKTVNSALKTKHEVIVLENLFSEALWKKSLLKEWHDLINRPANQLAFKTSVSDLEALSMLIKKRSSRQNVHTFNTILSRYGIFKIVNSVGIKNFKNLVGSHWSEKTVGSRLSEKINDTLEVFKEIPTSEHISLIEHSLQEFNCYNPKV